MRRRVAGKRGWQVLRESAVFAFMPPDAVEITRVNSDCVLGFGAGVAIALWRYETTGADVLELQKTAERAHAAAGQPIALIQVVAASAIPPDAQVRTALGRMLASLLGRVSHSAIVHETEGFRAAMIRSIVTGLVALSNPGFPHRVFSTVEESVSWMTSGNANLQRAKLLLAIESVRAAAHSAQATDASRCRSGTTDIPADHPRSRRRTRAT